jgi:hypothetical protein
LLLLSVCWSPQALLSALVNKLGDPSRKLASDAAFLLGQLLLQHPAMKAVVVREVSKAGFCLRGQSLSQRLQGLRSGV